MSPNTVDFQEELAHLISLNPQRIHPDANNTKEHLRVGQIINFKLGYLTDYIPAIVRGVHNYSTKVKYDIEVAMFVSDGENRTWTGHRLYNVESSFCLPFQL
jgi:hypothetical protein